MNERRQHPRIPSALSAEVSAGAGRGILSARTENISLGGVGLVLGERLERGAAVRVAFYLTDEGIEDPHGPQVELAAEVMWARPTSGGAYAAGLRFLTLSPPQRQTIHRYMARLGLS